MPIVSPTYRPPWGWHNGHLQTIAPALWRRVPDVVYHRERLETPDGDFLDLDWSAQGKDRLVLILHGLEGGADRAYVRGMVRAFNRADWTAVGMNHRGCSGEINRKPYAYHGGRTEDLALVLQHINRHHDYAQIVLIGFSLGGNMLLKYLGETAELPPNLSGGIAVSVPCDFRSSAYQLAKPVNQIYMRWFLKTLRKKVVTKAALWPDQISAQDVEKITTFIEFDRRYVAPLYGFADEEAYWAATSCKPVLPHIRVPTLLLNARNDPFLAEPCFPVEEAEQNPHFFLDMPASGGHVGFVQFNRWGLYGAEACALAFCTEQISRQ